MGKKFEKENENGKGGNNCQKNASHGIQDFWKWKNIYMYTERTYSYQHEHHSSWISHYKAYAYKQLCANLLACCPSHFVSTITMLGSLPLARLHLLLCPLATSIRVWPQMDSSLQTTGLKEVSPPIPSANVQPSCASHRVTLLKLTSILPGVPLPSPHGVRIYTSIAHGLYI